MELVVKPSQGRIISIFRNHFFKAEISRYDLGDGFGFKLAGGDGRKRGIT